MKLRNKSDSIIYNPSKLLRRQFTRQQLQESSLLIPSDNELLMETLHHHQSIPRNYVIDKFHSLSLNDKEFSETKSDYSDPESNSSQLYFDDDSKSLISTCDTFSIISSNSFDSAEESDVYHSSISHLIKRRKCEGSDSVDELQDSSDHLFDCNLPKYISESSKLKQKNKKIILWVIFSLLLLTIVFSLTEFFMCKIEDKEPFDLKSIKGNLSLCLIGQDFSRVAIMDALATFDTYDPNTNKVHLLWLVGPVGVGKSYTRHLIKSSIGSGVQDFSLQSFLLPKRLGVIREEVKTLIQSLSICKPNLIWIDGFDEEDPVLSYLNSFFEQFKFTRRKLFYHIPIKVLIVLTGTHMSEYVKQSYVRHIADGQKRLTFHYNQLQQKLTKASPFKKITVSFHLVVIPFLPLEVIHIEKCVIQQIQQQNLLSRHKNRCVSKSSPSLEKFVKLQNLTLERIQGQVLELFYHTAVNDSSKIVPSGCKRVYHVVTSLLYKIPYSEFIDSS